MSEPTRVIIWRRVDGSAMEVSHVRAEHRGVRVLDGTVVVHDRGSFGIRYSIEVDSGWRTSRVSVDGTRDGEAFAMELRCDEGIWRRGDEHLPELDGCVDIDLGFSPLTNTLPIRRLGLSVGASAEVKAAWLRYPGFTLEVLEQTYTRVSELEYRYQSRTGFEAVLAVDEHGLVVDYPGGWRAEL